MSDLISKSELLKKMKWQCRGHCKKCEYSTFLANDEHCGLIDEQPTVEAKPVVHGEWEIGGVQGNMIGNFKCSVCKGVSLKDSNFCPNCGADMRK